MGRYWWMFPEQFGPRDFLPECLQFFPTDFEGASIGGKDLPGCRVNSGRSKMTLIESNPRRPSASIPLASGASRKFITSYLIALSLTRIRKTGTSGRVHSHDSDLLSEGSQELFCILNEVRGYHPFYDPFFWIYGPKNSDPLVGFDDELYKSHLAGVYLKVHLDGVHRVARWCLLIFPIRGQSRTSCPFTLTFSR
jgi:hypothetical protein